MNWKIGKAPRVKPPLKNSGPGGRKVKPTGKAIVYELPDSVEENESLTSIANERSKCAEELMQQQQRYRLEVDNSLGSLQTMLTSIDEDFEGTSFSYKRPSKLLDLDEEEVLREKQYRESIMAALRHWLESEKEQAAEIARLADKTKVESQSTKGAHEAMEYFQSTHRKLDNIREAYKEEIQSHLDTISNLQFELKDLRKSYKGLREQHYTLTVEMETLRIQNDFNVKKISLQEQTLGNTKADYERRILGFKEDVRLEKEKLNRAEQSISVERNKAAMIERQTQLEMNQLKTQIQILEQSLKTAKKTVSEMGDSINYRNTLPSVADDIADSLAVAAEEEEKRDRDTKRYKHLFEEAQTKRVELEREITKMAQERNKFLLMHHEHEQKIEQQLDEARVEAACLKKELQREKTSSKKKLDAMLLNHTSALAAEQEAADQARARVEDLEALLQDSQETLTRVNAEAASKRDAALKDLREKHTETLAANTLHVSHLSDRLREVSAELATTLEELAKAKKASAMTGSINRFIAAAKQASKPSANEGENEKACNTELWDPNAIGSLSLGLPQEELDQLREDSEKLVALQVEHSVLVSRLKDELAIEKAMRESENNSAKERRRKLFDEVSKLQAQLRLARDMLAAQGVGAGEVMAAMVTASNEQEREENEELNSDFANTQNDDFEFETDELRMGRIVNTLQEEFNYFMKKSCSCSSTLNSWLLSDDGLNVISALFKAKKCDVTAITDALQAAADSGMSLLVQIPGDRTRPPPPVDDVPPPLNGEGLAATSRTGNKGRKMSMAPGLGSLPEADKKTRGPQLVSTDMRAQQQLAAQFKEENGDEGAKLIKQHQVQTRQLREEIQDLKIEKASGQMEQERLLKEMKQLKAALQKAKNANHTSLLKRQSTLVSGSKPPGFEETPSEQPDSPTGVSSPVGSFSVQQSGTNTPLGSTLQSPLKLSMKKAPPAFSRDDFLPEGLKAITVGGAASQLMAEESAKLQQQLVVEQAHSAALQKELETAREKLKALEAKSRGEPSWEEDNGSPNPFARTHPQRRRPPSPAEVEQATPADMMAAVEAATDAFQQAMAASAGSPGLSPPTRPVQMLQELADQEAGLVDAGLLEQIRKYLECDTELQKKNMRVNFAGMTKLAKLKRAERAFAKEINECPPEHRRPMEEKLILMQDQRAKYQREWEEEKQAVAEARALNMLQTLTAFNKAVDSANTEWQSRLELSKTTKLSREEFLAGLQGSALAGNAADLKRRFDHLNALPPISPSKQIVSVSSVERKFASASETEPSKKAFSSQPRKAPHLSLSNALPSKERTGSTEQVLPWPSSGDGDDNRHRTRKDTHRHAARAP